MGEIRPVVEEERRKRSGEGEETRVERIWTGEKLDERKLKGEEGEESAWGVCLVLGGEAGGRRRSVLSTRGRRWREKALGALRLGEKQEGGGQVSILCG